MQLEGRNTQGYQVFGEPCETSERVDLVQVVEGWEARLLALMRQAWIWIDTTRAELDEVEDGDAGWGEWIYDLVNLCRAAMFSLSSLVAWSSGLVHAPSHLTVCLGLYVGAGRDRRVVLTLTRNQQPRLHWGPGWLKFLSKDMSRPGRHLGEHRHASPSS